MTEIEFRVIWSPRSSEQAATATTIALLSLMRLKGVGPTKALAVIPKAIEGQSAQDVYDTLSPRLKSLGRPVSRDVFSNAWNLTVDILALAYETGLRAVSFHDAKYPTRLRSIPKPPAALFFMGNISALAADRSLAIVGTREPTAAGETDARQFARTAAEEGFVIVSGLAHGCDTHAHQGCLDAGGTGVAVLAHGLDSVYPAANRDLAQHLLDHKGCLVSEYPIGALPHRAHFVERDRIQSGLADAVLVVQTGVKDGTMHTVGFAAEQHRPLACIDYADIAPTEHPAVAGNRLLIDDGRATPIADADALAEYLRQLPAQPSAPPRPGTLL